MEKNKKLQITRFVIILLFMLSLAQNVNFYLKYQRLQELYIEAISSANLKDKPRHDSKGFNKEYQNLNIEILRDINKKAGELSQKGIITDSELENTTEKALKQTITELENDSEAKNAEMR